jgi:hypothetical protein
MIRYRSNFFNLISVVLLIKEWLWDRRQAVSKIIVALSFLETPLHFLRAVVTSLFEWPPPPIKQFVFGWAPCNLTLSHRIELWDKMPLISMIMRRQITCILFRVLRLVRVNHRVYRANPWLSFDFVIIVRFLFFVKGRMQSRVLFVSKWVVVALDELLVLLLGYKGEVDLLVKRLFSLLLPLVFVRLLISRWYCI